MSDLGDFLRGSNPHVDRSKMGPARPVSFNEWMEIFGRHMPHDTEDELRTALSAAYQAGVMQKDNLLFRTLNDPAKGVFKPRIEQPVDPLKLMEHLQALQKNSGQDEST